MIDARDLTLEAADGYRLAATLHAPPGARRVAVLSPAMGVRRGFYAPFAQYLASRGIAALVYDYRGIGGSRPARLRGATMELRHWGELDLDAAIGWARAELAPERLYLVGHSVGGQIAGLAAQSRHAHALLAVAAQSGWWGHWSGAGKLGMWLLWHAGIPLLTRACGFFPARLLGIGADLPAGVARQWARWGRDRRYIRGRHAPPSVANFEAIRAPLLAIGIARDGYAPRPAIESMLSWFPNARTELREVGFRDARGRRLDHFSWFRAELGEPFWRECADWLEAQR
jgi:predicted alpha/beta hydrolase